MFKIYHFILFQSMLFPLFIVYLPVFRYYSQMIFGVFVHINEITFHVTFHEIIALQIKYYLV